MKSNIFKIISLILLVVGTALGTFLVLDAFGLVTIGEVEQLTISLTSKQKEYDGNPLTITNADYTITSGTLNENFELELTPSKSITEVGSTICNAEFKVFNKETGKDVTSLFKFTVNPATLTITKKQITVECKTTEFEYDGTQLSPDTFQVTSGSLVIGHKLDSVITNIEGGIEPGTSSCTVSLSILDKNGYDVTSNYNLSSPTREVEFTITKRTIDYSPSILEKTYDGEAFTLSSVQYQLTKGVLAYGDTATVSIEGLPMVNASTYQRKLVVSIIDSNGNDVTSCYNFSSKTFSFVINPMEVTVDLPNVYKEYDTKNALDELYAALNELNNSLEDISITLKQEKEVELEDITQVKVSSTGRVTSYELTKDDFDINNTNTNIKVVLNSGSITINQKELEVTFPNITKTYDGSKFNATDITDSIYVTGIVDKDEYSLTLKWSDIFDFKKDDDDNTIVPEQYHALAQPTYYSLEIVPVDEDIYNNYKIKVIDGLLMINQKELNITISDETHPITTDSETIAEYLSSSYTLSNSDDQSNTVVTYDDSVYTNISTYSTSTLYPKTVAYDGSPVNELVEKPTTYDDVEEWEAYILYLKSDAENDSDYPLKSGFSLTNPTDVLSLVQYINKLEKNLTNIPDVVYTSNTGSITLKKMIIINMTSSEFIKDFNNKTIQKDELAGKYEIDESSTLTDNVDDLDDLDDLFHFIVPTNYMVCDLTDFNLTAKYIGNESDVVVKVNLYNNEFKYQIKKKSIDLKINTDTLTKIYDGEALIVPTDYILSKDTTEFNFSDDNVFVSDVYIEDSNIKLYTSDEQTVNITGISIKNKSNVDVTDCYDISYYKGNNETTTPTVTYKINKKTIYVSLDDYTYTKGSITGNDDPEEILAYRIVRIVNSSIINSDTITSWSIDLSDVDLETADSYSYGEDCVSFKILNSNNETVSNCYSIVTIYSGTLTVVE